MVQTDIQIGKNGITENFLVSLKSQFKNHENVKISVLKSAGHDKQKVRNFSEQILENLGKSYTARIIGFSIFLKKWRKAPK